MLSVLRPKLPAKPSEIFLHVKAYTILRGHRLRHGASLVLQFLSLDQEKAPGTNLKKKIPPTIMPMINVPFKMI